MDRIKSVRKKTSGGDFTTPVPFGTDGILVDMLSGLDNEKELKLGGNHKVSIEETNGITTVTELYYRANGTTVAYTVETVISTENNTTTIISSLWEGIKSGAAATVKTTTIPEGADITEVLS